MLDVLFCQKSDFTQRGEDLHPALLLISSVNTDLSERRAVRMIISSNLPNVYVECNRCK